MKYFLVRLSILMFMTLFNILAQAQGPPVTIDKPIMLGAKSLTLQSLSEYREVGERAYFVTPFKAFYLPTSDMSVGVRIPFIMGKSKTETLVKPFSGLGDIQLSYKYQFLRKDQMGKTFRVSAKLMQNIAIGETISNSDINFGQHQTYLGLVSGYETLKHGISSELGYRLVHRSNRHMLHANLGFGLPLLKPVYPSKQLNIMFEYSSVYMPQQDAFALNYVQGVQFVKGAFIIEGGARLPLVRSALDIDQMNFGLLLGMRYVI